MITANIDMTEFNRGMAGLIHQVGLSGPLVVEKETGELIKTLVRISPPAEPTKTRASIKANLEKTFHIFGKFTNHEYDDTKTSKTGVKWYMWNPKFLFGSTPDKDMRKASHEDLMQVHYRRKNVQGSARIIMPFKKPRRGQRVAMITRVITTEKNVKKLITRISKHVGRLKAGWLKAVFKGEIKVTGGYLPPQWVTRHANGARGDYKNELSVKDSPAFTIINQAKGVSSKVSKYFLSKAVDIRAKAMVKNATFFMNGKKNLSDYAKGDSILQLSA